MSESRFAAACTAGYAAVLGVNLSRHEMWRDEFQAWIIAEESTSVASLAANTAYEGHPLLWFLLLFAAKQLYAGPAVVQVVHWLVASAAAWVFVRFAPGRRLYKGLFLLGYFPLYEYGTISRGYALGLLLVFAFCALYSRRPQAAWRLAALLFFLAQTSVFGTIFAVYLAAFVAWELWKSGAAREAPGRWIGAGTLVGVGGVLACGQMLPPSDSGYLTSWYTEAKVGRLVDVLALVWQVACPLPRLQVEFWDTNILDPAVSIWSGEASARDVGLVRLQAALGTACLGLSLWAFAGRRRALYFFALGCAGLLIFFYIKLVGGLRHSGHLFLFGAVVFWLCPRPDEPVGTKGAWRGGGLGRRVAPAVFLLMHAGVGVGSSAADFFLPFSGSRATAAFIEGHPAGKGALAAYPDHAATGVAGFSGRRFYFPEGDRWGRFVVWDQARLNGGRAKDDVRIIEAAAGELGTAGVPWLLLVNRPLGNLPQAGRLLYRSQRSIAQGERFWVYELPTGTLQW